MERLFRVAIISGIFAGLAMAIFSVTVGRAPLNAALLLEESLDHDHGGVGHESLISRGTQEAGGFLGLIIFGIALSVIFMIVWGKVAPQLPAKTMMLSTLQLGAIGFFTVVVVPFAKYPANPPAVGDPDTVDERTIQYAIVVVFSIVLTVAVWKISSLIAGSESRRAWVAAALYFVGLLAIGFVLPASPDVVEAPTDLVWQFRLASLGALASGWLVLSLMSGSLLTMFARRESEASQPIRVPAAAR